MNSEQGLRDRIEQLESLLGVDRSTAALLREAFGLEPLWAQMLGMFYKRDFVTRDGLYTVLYEGRPESEWPDDKMLDTQLSKMRKHLRNTGNEALAEAIETRWGEGWSLTRAGKDIVRDAVEQTRHVAPAVTALDLWRLAELPRKKARAFVLSISRPACMA